MQQWIKYTLLGWVVLWAIFILVLGSVIPLETSIVRVSSMVIPQSIIFYLNLLYFTPKLLEKGKIKEFVGAIIGTLLLYSIVGAAIDFNLIEKYPISPFHKHAHFTFLPYLGRFLTAIPPLVISTLIIKSILLRKRTRESMELKHRMLEAETKALKAQINPHFLFNTLNNIYSLSQMKSNKTSTAIMNLSDILKYVTYEGSQNLVKLESEIQQIKNFIELQYLKDDDHSNIDVTINVPQNSFEIAPLLLIPFIENCFKHGNHEDKQNGWIRIYIHLEEDHLFVECSNTFAIAPQQKDDTGGVGLENVKKRLSLLYPEKNDLKTEIKDNTYSVILNLTLSL